MQSAVKARAALWFLECYEVLPAEKTVTDLSDEDAKAVEILETLRDSVDAIPPSLIKAAEELRAAGARKIRRDFGTRHSSSRLRFFPDQLYRVRRSSEPNCATRSLCLRTGRYLPPHGQAPKRDEIAPYACVPPADDR
jgi:hypothetical protein